MLDQTDSAKNNIERSYLAQLERTLIALVDELPAVPQVKEAVRHALFPAGKRIRPVLALALCEDLGGAWEDLLIPAAAIEFVHCASLIHDDLPALDNDDLRRGKPSCHKAFGEATAILTGDLMVSHALLVLTRSPYDAAVRLAMVELLSHGFVDVCNGQQLDLLPKELRGNLGNVLEVHKLKTGALFSVATSFAALASGASEQTVSKAKELGMLLGVLFQVVDDYLDRFGEQTETGRPQGSDARNSRLTAFSKEDETEGRVLFNESLSVFEKAKLAFITEAGLGSSLNNFDNVVAKITSKLR